MVNQLVIASHGGEGDGSVHGVVHEANHVTKRATVHGKVRV